ncbi:MAG: tetraacyldisaccharide 4'-kinase [Bacteroidales bacterium]|nr:tetraacyldisaccharide 4'-kinase [Bacteroidales bacterium]
MIYRIILSLRNARYKKGRHTTAAGVPTICVGNITVGGTGKTPHAEMILRELLASERWGMSSLALLSRGYKRRSKGFQQVPFDGSAALYGDEPVQVKRKFPTLTVAVDKDRIQGCDILVHPEKAAGLKKCAHPQFPPADLVILDDAFQYRRLKASLSIVLVDWNRPVTEDSLLPWGRLRDLPSRLYDADIVVVSKCPYVLDELEKQEMARTLGYDSFDPGTGTAVRKGRPQTLLFTGISYDRLQGVFDSADPRYIYSKKLILFTGIADDTPLLRHLSDSYKIVHHLHFPDHHRYTRADVRALKSALRHNPTAALATTEKDAQRLRDLKSLPDSLKARLFFVPITTDFLSDAERETFRQFINNL